MQHSPKPAVSLVTISSLGVLTGCGRAPSFSILGSFFPAWLICMVVGILLAAIVNWILSRSSARSSSHGASSCIRAWRRSSPSLCGSSSLVSGKNHGYRPI
jgi:hypothetical protein